MNDIVRKLLFSPQRGITIEHLMYVFKYSTRPFITAEDAHDPKTL